MGPGRDNRTSTFVQKLVHPLTPELPPGIKVSAKAKMERVITNVMSPIEKGFPLLLEETIDHDKRDRL